MGFDPLKGNPEIKICLKLTEKFHEFIHVPQSHLHLLLHSLSFVAIAVDQMKGIQTLFTCLQFQVHLQNNIHPFLHLLSHFFFLVLHAFMLHAGPFVFQSHQTIIYLLHNHLVTLCSRHLDSARDQ